MIVAKQARSERLLRSARKLAKLIGQKRERVLLYEAMQRDMPGELSSLHRALGLQFDLDAHNRAAARLVALAQARDRESIECHIQLGRAENRLQAVPVFERDAIGHEPESL